MAKRFRLFRNATGLGQKQLAPILGVSPKRISKYETGEEPVSVLTAKRAELLCGISSDWLLNGESGEPLTPTGHHYDLAHFKMFRAMIVSSGAGPAELGAEYLEILRQIPSYAVFAMGVLLSASEVGKFYEALGKMNQFQKEMIDEFGFDLYGLLVADHLNRESDPLTSKKSFLVLRSLILDALTWHFEPRVGECRRNPESDAVREMKKRLRAKQYGHITVQPSDGRPNAALHRRKQAPSKRRSPASSGRSKTKSAPAPQ